MSNDQTNKPAQVAMPGDADEPGTKMQEVLRKARGKGRVSGEPVDEKEAKASTDDAVKTSKELDDAADVTKDAAKGPNSTAQHDDDGWGDTPVQMRGE